MSFAYIGVGSSVKRRSSNAIRIVFRPELAAVYGFILAAKDAVSRPDAHRAFMPDYADLWSVSTQSIDDAFSFLVSADLSARLTATMLLDPSKPYHFASRS